jgi:hypothetical protein
MAALAMAIPSRISIGADGILWRWLFLRRFYPYSQMLEVMPADNGVQLFLKDALVHLATSPARQRTHVPSLERREAVATRIREGLAAYQGGRGAANVAALVARSGRTTEQWLKALRDLSGGGEYRAAAVPTEQLWRIAEDPSAAPSARVGAAVALRKQAQSLDEEGKKRLRIAARAVVSPAAQKALEAVAQSEDAPGLDDDAALEEALALCKDDERRRAV